jgi:hypothetical protein
MWSADELGQGLIANRSRLRLEGKADDDVAFGEVRVDNGARIVMRSQTAGGFSAILPLDPLVNSGFVEATDWAGNNTRFEFHIAYVRATRTDPRAVAYWRRAQGLNHYSAFAIGRMLSYVDVASTMYGPGTFYGRVRPSQYLQLLAVGFSASLEDRMKAEILANWLNLASGRVKASHACDLNRVPHAAQLGSGDMLLPAQRAAWLIERVLLSYKLDPRSVSRAQLNAAYQLSEGINNGWVLR